MFLICSLSTFFFLPLVFTRYISSRSRAHFVIEHLHFISDNNCSLDDYYCYQMTCFQLLCAEKCILFCLWVLTEWCFELMIVFNFFFSDSNGVYQKYNLYLIIYLFIWVKAEDLTEISSITSTMPVLDFVHWFAIIVF